MTPTNRKIGHEADFKIGMTAIKMVANFATPRIAIKGQIISATATSKARSHANLTPTLKDLAAMTS